MVGKILQYFFLDIKLIMFLLLKDLENMLWSFIKCIFLVKNSNFLKVFKEKIFILVVYQFYVYIIISVYSIIKVMMFIYYDKIIIFFILIGNI